MKKLCKVTFQGGCHGNFLRYFLDRFSSLTPPITELPFTDNGTSHVDIKYSNLIELTKAGFDRFEDNIEPVIFITVEQENIVFLERWINNRVDDHKIDLNKDWFNDQQIELLQWREKLKNMYNITGNIVPRSVKRDLYKMGYLDPLTSGYLKLDKQTKKILPENSLCVSGSDFWDKNQFQNMVWRIDAKTNLQIKNVDWSVYDEFYKRLEFIDTRHRVQQVIECINNDKDMDLGELDVVEEGFISAYLEEHNDFIQVPFCNNFFANTKEISQWLKIYPQHYKAMNPNLPKFNGILNPFHLWNLKK